MFLGIIYILPTFIPLLFQTIKKNYGGANHDLLDHLESELLLGKVVKMRDPTPEEDMVEMFGGVHVDKEYANVLRVGQLPLLYFKDLATYNQHKQMVDTTCPKCLQGTLTLDAPYDEVVIYHITGTNLIPSLIQLVLQAKNDYIPHPSLNLSDSFNIDRAFIVVMFSISSIPPELHSFLEYLKVINNLSNFRLITVINDLHSRPQCSAISIPRHNYHIILDTSMDTSALHTTELANVEMVPYSQTQILRYVMKEKKAPHIDVFDLHTAAPGDLPKNVVIDAIMNIPASSYAQQYVSCDDLYKEGMALNMHMELSREVEKLVAPMKHRSQCKAREKQLLYVLGERFEVNEVLHDLMPHALSSDILIVPPRQEHLPDARAKLECRNKLCAIELWCRATDQHLLDHTTTCYHTKPKATEYCLCRGSCSPSTDCEHIFFHPTHRVSLPHLAYTLRPYESICYWLKE